MNGGVWRENEPVEPCEAAAGEPSRARIMFKLASCCLAFDDIRHAFKKHSCSEAIWIQREFYISNYYTSTM